MSEDYTGRVYDQLRRRGSVGDLVRFDIKPWLIQTYDMTDREAQRARRRAMGNLRARGLPERVNVRGPCVHILG